MAFDASTLLQARMYGVWVYKTEDPIATVELDDYFLAAFDQLGIGDRILVTQVTDLGESSEAYVDHDNRIVLVATSNTVITASTLLVPYAHNMVLFQSGVDRVYRRAGNFAGAPTSTDYFTIAFKVTRLSNTPVSRSLFRLQPPTFGVTPFLSVLQIAGQKYNIFCYDIGVSSGFDFQTAATTINEETTIHVAADRLADGVGKVYIWINGVPQTTVTWWGNGAAIEVGDTNLVGGDIGLTWNTNVGFFYLSYEFDDDPTHFFNGGDVDLGDDGTLTGAPAPIVFFGGRQKADERAGDSAKGWNDGFNQGTGGTFELLDGAVSDV